MLTKILFVDDESLILQSIKRIMRSKKIEIYLAECTDEAFSILDTNRIDIVVTDVRMPDMNGIDFLKEVRQKYPHIYRLILSGQVERNDVLNAILQGIAFEYLTKPWKKDVLRENLNHIIEIQLVLSNEKIVKLINSIIQLPKNMEILRTVEEAINKEASIEHIANIIIEDISITTKILQMINSAFYSIKRVSSIHQAISILGLNTIKSLIFASSFMEIDQLDTWQKKENVAFMKRLATVNRVYTLLYQQLLNKELPGEFSSFGLVYNIGKLININFLPERHLSIVEYIKKHDTDYYNAEIDLGYKGETHQEIGAYFLALWNFSKSNVEVALFHHAIDRAAEEYRDAFTILNKASENVRQLGVEQIEKLKNDDLLELLKGK